MENKTSVIVIINVIIFLLYLKFGSMAFWAPAAIGFSLIVLFIIIILILQLFFIGTYETRFLPALKRITGSDFLVTTMSNEQRTTIKKGILPLLFVITALAGIIRLVIWGIFLSVNKK